MVYFTMKAKRNAFRSVWGVFASGRPNGTRSVWGVWASRGPNGTRSVWGWADLSPTCQKTQKLIFIRTTIKKNDKLRKVWDLWVDNNTNIAKGTNRKTIIQQGSGDLAVDKNDRIRRTSINIYIYIYIHRFTLQTSNFFTTETTTLVHKRFLTTQAISLLQKRLLY